MNKYSIKSISCILFLHLISCNNPEVNNENKKSTLSDSSAYTPKQYVELKHPEWSRNATIYEVNIRQFTPEGNFKAFESHLPRLKELGIDIIWLMPIHPIGELKRKETMGSYYSVKDYLAVNPEFGSMDEFKSFV